MGGGLLQLVAYGAQDIYLTGNPQITFFKMIYRRYTNFSIESIQQSFSSTVDFGRKVSATISKNGDLLFKTYIQVTLPQIDCGLSSDNKFRWLNWLGHVMIKTVDIEIGGQQIDKHYSEWLHIWNELTQETGKKEGYASMVGNVPRLTQVVQGDSNASTIIDSQNVLDSQGAIPSINLYIPLNFWFCRSPGLALPLIALQYHDIKINVEFRDAADCCWATGKYLTNPPSLTSAVIYCDYIYLDTEERRKFAEADHEYLIEQLQFRGNEATTSTNNKVKLAFNHPVKLLTWVTQPIDYISSTFTNDYGGKQWYNFSDQIDVSYYNGTPQDALGPGLVSSNNMNFGLPLVGTGSVISGAQSGSENPQYRPEAGTVTGQGIDVSTGGFNNIFAPSIISSLNTNATSSNIPLFDFGSNCTDTAKLTLNGHDRFSERDNRYFNLVQPYQHCTNIPAVGINIYSFALEPEKLEPTGTCNFSRIDISHLLLNLTPQTVKNSRVANIRIYALSYNILRISNGMGGLAYSN